MKRIVTFVILFLLKHAILLQGWSVSRFWRRESRRFVEFDDSTETDIHHFFMSAALREARKAGEAGEVPIGALVVRNMTAIELDPRFSEQRKASAQAQSQKASTRLEILATGSNRVETDRDASAHAELLALRRAAREVDNWRLLHCTIYSTLEPCPMCLSAALAFRVDTIVYGAPDLRLGAIHTKPLSLQNPFHGIKTVVSGVQREESAQLIRDFFRARRSAPEPTTARAIPFFRTRPVR